MWLGRFLFVVKMANADLAAEYSEAEQLFTGDFRAYRGANGTWGDIIKRRLKIDIPPEWTPIQEGIDYQSPIPEKALQDYKAILGKNPTEIDVHVYGEGQEYRTKERKLLLTLAAAWSNLMNFNHVFDKGAGEGQARNGISVWWLRHKKKTGEAEQKWPFYLEHVVADGVAFPMPGADNEPDAFWYRFVVPVFGCGVRNSKGERPTLDQVGNLGWLGKGEQADYTTTAGKKFEVYVRDARKLDGDMCGVDGCDHEQRQISVHIAPAGAGFKEAELVEEIDSPFPACSFIIVPGNEQIEESDPHDRYRPLMSGLYHLATWYAMARTWAWTLARNEADDQYYLNVGATSPDVIAAFGLGAEGGMKQSIEAPQKGENEWMALPGTLERYPRNYNQFLTKNTDDIAREMVDFMPNRYLTGSAYSEASNATGSAFLAQLQQAALPFEQPLGNTDAAIHRILTYCLHAIKYWGLIEDTSWAVVMTGKEHPKRYNDYGVGEKLSISAKDLDCAFDISLKTEAISQIQKQAAWLELKDQAFSGYKTDEQVWEGLGFSDIEGQKEKIFVQKVDRYLEPLYAQMVAGRAILGQSNKSGYDVRQLMQNGSGMPEAGGQQVPPQGNNPGSENTLLTPPNAQMGRSAQQTAYATGMMAPSLSGGT